MSYIVQPPLLPLKAFFESDTNDRLVLVLGVLDLDPLLRLLDRRQGRGRRGYAHRAMLQAVIAGWVYNLHSMAELRRELLRNGSLRLLVGMQSVGQVPSEDAFSRFYARLAGLREEVDKLHALVIDKIRALNPEVGKQVAVDSTAINAWANGNRSQPADPDASWGCKGHKEKGESAWWFGYKEHLAVDTAAELTLAYHTTTASVSDSKNLTVLLEKLDRRLPAGHLEAVMADAQYDSQDNYAAVWFRGALPIIDFNDRGWEPPVGYTAEGMSRSHVSAGDQQAGATVVGGTYSNVSGRIDPWTTRPASRLASAARALAVLAQLQLYVRMAELFRWIEPTLWEVEGADQVELTR